jgi:hypothetical protein
VRPAGYRVKFKEVVGLLHNIMKFSIFTKS